MTSQKLNCIELLRIQNDLLNQMHAVQSNFKKTVADNRRTETFFQAKLENLRHLHTEFEKHHMLVLQSELEITHDYYSKNVAIGFEELYVETLSEITEAYKIKFPENSIFNSTQFPPSSSNSHQSTAHQSNNSSSIALLPKMSAPVFSGKYTDWPSFYDSYVRLIHNELRFTDVERFYYLKLALPEGCDSDIRELPLTAANYPYAWKTLVSRYNNSRVLFTHYMTLFYSQPNITKENATDIKRLVDTSRSCIGMLRQLKVKVNECDEILVHFLITKLPIETHALWEEKLGSSNEIPGFDQFATFLDTRYRTLEALQFNSNSNFNSQHDSTKATSQSKPYLKPQYNKQTNNFRRESRVNHISSSVDNKQISCALCRESHVLRRCSKFLSMDCFERKSFAERKKHCANCLSANHLIASCSSTKNCQICGKRHHTLLHPPNTNNSSIPSNSTNSNSASTTSVNGTANHTISTNHINQNLPPVLSNATKFTSKTQVLLPTAVVKVIANDGSTYLLRTLIDQGSTGALISERATQSLNLQRLPMTTSINLPNGQRTSGKFTTKFTIQSRIDDQFKCDVFASVVKSVTDNLPTKTITHHDWPHLRGIEFADPEFFRSAPIDLLIGSDLVADILLEGLRKGKENEPIAQQTSLGWIVSGKALEPTEVQTTNIETNCSHITLEHLDSLVKQFYALESIPAEEQFTPEEKWCTEHFKQTHIRQPNGKYLVRLPLKTRFDSTLTLGKSRQTALNRFNQLERKLNNNFNVREQYHTAINGYFELNQIKPIDIIEDQHFQLNDNNQANYTCCTLPHHAVINSCNLTTQCRVVYDASAKTSSGKSLNDILCIGPPLQNDLPAVLLNWRMHVYVITADIEKMFRCIDVHEEDSEYQRILWRDNTGQIKDYKLTTVTFGTSCAPYLANETLHQIASDERERYPLAAHVLCKETYVDDIYSGSHTIEKASEIRDHTQNALQSAGMKLHKWASNSTELLKSIPKEQQSSTTALELNSNETLKTLGMRWQPNIDCFRYQLNFDVDFSKQPITKRIVLATTAKLFDPLGLTSPVIVIAKIFLKRLWSLQLSWDGPLSDELRKEWEQIVIEVPKLNLIQIPRWLQFSPKTTNRIELHAFCDGSSQAYASIVYMRVQDDQNKFHTNIITAKSKVTPKPPICIPRVELCGAVMSIKLVKWVLKHLHVTDMQIAVYYWTDATIVLSWIRGDINRWPVFVANRIGVIHTESHFSQWHHISTHENPADHSTRGLTPTQLMNSDLYWHGPKWLCEPKENWPVSDWTFLEENETEHLVNAAIETSDEIPLFDRYSSYTQLIRIIAILLRFKHNLTSIKTNRRTGSLLVTELQASLLTLVRMVQKQSFFAEYKALSKREQISHKSLLISLTPFLDENNIIRVRGRLQNAKIPFNEKHPIILPKNHRFTQLLIDFAHKNTLHGSIELTSAFLRKQFWIIHSRKVIASAIKECIICFRQKPQISQQLMGNLPESRVTANVRPFLATGVDYTGAIELKASRYRGQTTYKGYIAVFICLATKAIHLEAVTGMSTDQFLCALQRFIGRRGLCHDMYSDCGTNFSGADKVLQTSAQKFRESVQNDIVPFLANKGIQWHFNPPHSPNFGGIWEANVKAVKFHLKRICNGTPLTYEELSTVLARIESCLNSRPLCTLTSESDDLTVLTPGHFLIGNALLAPPEPAVLDLAPHRQYHKLQRMYQQFWARWSSDWLSHLQSRPKWCNQKVNLKVNDMVIVKDDRLPPNQWLLGRIVEVHPGEDELVRVVTVRTQHGKYKRCVSKICRLPIDTPVNTQ